MSVRKPFVFGVVISSAVVSLICASVTLSPFTFGYFSVCSKCGMWRDTVQYQLPRVDVTYHRRHRLRHTKLSRILAEGGAVGDHEHAWVFGWGAGNGVRCAIGAGGELDYDNNGVELVIPFVEALLLHADRDTRAQWIHYALTPSPSPRTLDVVLACSGFPPEGFEDKDAFDDWWERSASDRTWYLQRFRSAQLRRTAAAGP